MPPTEWKLAGIRFIGLAAAAAALSVASGVLAGETVKLGIKPGLW